jgi:hypothetical protein
MRMKLFGGTMMAVMLALTAGAWAGDSNMFNNGSVTTTKTSTSTNNTTGNTLTNSTINSVSNVESFNTTIEGVASQVLTATVTGASFQNTGTVTGTGDAAAASQIGGATATIGQNTSGVAQAGANSGVGGIMQQGLVIATGANASF